MHENNSMYDKKVIKFDYEKPTQFVGHNLKTRVLRNISPRFSYGTLIIFRLNFFAMIGLTECHDLSGD